jgi:SAM-dependent methyltransferase
LGFLVHPHIPHSSPGLRIADIAAGTGIWLLDLAKTLPPTCTFTGFDITQSTFPPRDTWPGNVTFKIQDMLSPFPEEELGSYDLVAVRFISSATTRSEWRRAIVNLVTLLKPGGWLQWIDSCNFKMYNEVAGVSRAANLEIYEALAPFRAKEDLVIGLLIQEPKRLFRESVFLEAGLKDVHEDVFSSDRLPGLRKVGTKNIMECFIQNMGDLIGMEGSGWSEEKIKNLHAAALEEVDRGVYHTLDQVCIVGRKPAVAEDSAIPQ